MVPGGPHKSLALLGYLSIIGIAAAYVSHSGWEAKNVLVGVQNEIGTLFFFFFEWYEIGTAILLIVD